MPFVLAGANLRVAVVPGDSIITMSDAPPAVATFPAGTAVQGFNKVGMDSRALLFGPFLSGGEVIVTAAQNTDVDLTRGAYSRSQTATVVTLTAAEIAAPTADIIGDTTSTYQLNVAPYTRYMSNGTALVQSGSGGGSSSWGGVTGSIGDQADLQAALSSKADAAALSAKADASSVPTTADARIAASRGANNGIAPLDGTGRVPAANLPSYVVEHANQGAFPATGESGKIYIALDTGNSFRWTGSVYATMGGTPQYPSQAEAVDGAENTKTMTPLRTAAAITARAKDATLTGYAVGTAVAVAGTDSVTQAIGKVEAKANAKADLLVPVFETATTGTLTAAGHANRETTITNAAAIARTLNLSGMVVGDAGYLFQGGAGAITLSLSAGTFSYSPGITASPTTTGVGGYIGWRVMNVTPGSESVLIFDRSQVAAGGGGTFPNAGVTLSASTTLTRAAHGNRTITVTGYSSVLTVDTDANAGWQSGDYILAIGRSTGFHGFSVEAASGVTIKAGNVYGTSVQSGVMVGDAIYMVWTTANAWTVINVKNPFITGIATRNSNWTLGTNEGGLTQIKTDANAYTYTVPDDSAANHVVGAVLRVANIGSAGNITVARASGVTLWNNGTNGDVVVPPGHDLTMRKLSSNVWMVF